ncbi:MAG: cation-translocating P-type ATPase, partial [Actinobacteria bacterium]|nr:cation-translocating P-type ATPase [Actinomycetota bacterium]
LDGSILMSTMVMIIGLSLYQQRKTSTALSALRALSAPLATVIRDSERVRIPTSGVVRGDLIVVSEGDRVPADARLVDGPHVMVDESMLTGESVPVGKSPAGGASGLPMACGVDSSLVFSGTLVVKGTGRAVVVATGNDTAVGSIGLSMEEIVVPPTPLQREIRRIVRVISVIGGGVAVLVAVVYSLLRDGILQGILVGIATAMALLPVEFLVVMSVFLALGAWRLSRTGVLARRPEVIETLGSVTVLCVDKTGTLTVNEMAVARMWTQDACVDVADGTVPDEFHVLAEFAALASPVDSFDPTDRAFRVLERRSLEGTEHAHGDWSLVREYPLSPDLTAMSHVWRSPDRAHFVIAAKGSPESVEALCHLDAHRRASLEAAVAELSGSGDRVLAVASARFGMRGVLPSSAHEFDFVLEGLVSLRDPVRPHVRDSVRRCDAAGVRTVMVTGDHAGTASAIARESGISRPDLEADVGIAMGRRGTDVARDAAGLVITDDDFGSIVNGIERGRGVFDNIRKAMTYVMAVHIPIAGMAVIPLFVRTWPFVLLPVQIAFLQMIIDPTSSLVFESEPIDPAVMERRPRRAGGAMFDRTVLTVTLFQGLAVLGCVLAVYLWSVSSGDSGDVTRSTAFVALVLSNLALMLVNRSWHLPAWRMLLERRNATVAWVMTITFAALAFVLGVPVCRRAFGFGTIGAGHLALSLGAAVAGVSWFEAYKWFRRAK